MRPREITADVMTIAQTSLETATAPRNRILARLPAEELEAMRATLTRVPLQLKQVVADVSQPIEHVYFCDDAIISVLSVMADGSAIESATVGNEGMVGVSLLLGVDRMALQAFVQVPGYAWRMDADAFAEAIARGGELPRLLGRYVIALITQMGQASGCNRKHTIEERCARWLLMTHDRVGRDEFVLTHHILSQMLGVRRATVTVAAGRFQRAGLIRYARGHVTIVDRAGLERAACECYHVVRAYYDRMLGASPA